MFSLGLKCVKWLVSLTKLEGSLVMRPKYRLETAFLRSSLILKPQLTLAVLQWRKSGKAIQSLGISDQLFFFGFLRSDQLKMLFLLHKG